MDTNNIISLVGSLGFPIVVCVYMGYFINTTIKEFRASMDKNTDAIQEVLTWIKATGGVRNE